MSSTAEQVKSVILKHKSGASKQQIAQELGLGLEYIGLICRELERKEVLVFRSGLYSLITSDHKPPKRRTKVLRRPLRRSFNEASLLRQPASTRNQGKRSKASKHKSRKSPNEVRSDFRGSRHQSGQKKFISNVSAKSVWLAIPKMTEDLRDVLERAGYKTIESLAEAPVARLMQETKLKLHEAAGLINRARKALNKIGE